MTDDARQPARYPGTPRWVKILGIATLALAATFVIVHLAGGGFRHHHPFKHDQPAHEHDGR
jgi:hypothetical protein